MSRRETLLEVLNWENRAAEEIKMRRLQRAEILDLCDEADRGEGRGETGYLVDPAALRRILAQ